MQHEQPKNYYKKVLNMRSPIGNANEDWVIRWDPQLISPINDYSSLGPRLRVTKLG